MQPALSGFHFVAVFTLSGFRFIAVFVVLQQSRTKPTISPRCLC